MNSTQRKLITLIKNHPEKVLNNRRIFEAAMKHLLRIISRVGVMPMVPNNTQKMILDAYFEQKKNRKPVRIIILKGRQQGSSTGVAAIMMLEMLCRPHLTALVCSEKKGGSAVNIFEKYEKFLEFYPEFPAEMSVRDRSKVFNKEKKLVLQNDANIRAEGQGDIVSFTNNIIHISEASRFSDFESFLGACLQGTESMEGTAVFIESTARAYGDGFHNEWQRASRGHSGFAPIFAPWFIHERNTMPLPEDEEEKQEFLQSIGKIRDRYGDEDVLKQQYNLTEEQLFWRRDRLDTACQGSMEMFKREFPSNANEAFLAQDTPVLHPRSLEWYHERTEPSNLLGYMLPENTGKREDGTQPAEFVESVHGAIEIWKEPEPYKEYVGGSDHSEGLPTGDFNTGLIASRMPFEIVAKIRGNDATKLDETSYAKQLYYLSRWYNEAYLLPESNAKGSNVLDLLNAWEYPNILWEADIYPETRSKRQGWYKTLATQKNAFATLYDALRIDFESNPEGIFRSEYAPIIPDAQTIEECQHIVWKSKGRAEAKRKGEYRAPGTSSIGCYDDLVIALMLTILAHKSLPDAKTPDDIKLELHGPDHELTDHIPFFVRDQFRAEPTEQLLGYNAWMGEL